MKNIAHQALLIYSAVLSTAFAILITSGWQSHGAQTFDEIRVHRIDIVEPDGTLRMVISDHDRLPGVIVKGKELPPSDRPQAGMIFYNNEGSENGGLIFGGRRNAKGEVIDSGGSLSFDKYGANQIVQLAGVDNKNDRFAGLAVGDEHRRIWVGRSDDGTAAVSLMDANGRKRIVMRVTQKGSPSLYFLNEKGKIVKRIEPTENP